MRWLVLLVLSGCGRLDFEPRTIDALTGHDEDGDGVPDAIDRCPHVAGDNADTDNDGVGDLCDPNPTIASEHYALFATMQAGDVPFDPNSKLVQGDDEITWTGTTTGLGFPQPLGTVRVELGFEIRGLVGDMQHQVAAGVETGSTPYYFVELNENAGGATRAFAIVRYDGAYTTVGGATHSGMHPGRGHLRFDAVLGTDAKFRAQGGWDGELYDVEGLTPGYTGGSYMRVALNGLDIALRYFVIIESN
jgi:hypothetical protein